MPGLVSSEERSHVLSELLSDDLPSIDTDTRVSSSDDLPPIDTCVFSSSPSASLRRLSSTSSVDPLAGSTGSYIHQVEPATEPPYGSLLCLLEVFEPRSPRSPRSVRPIVIPSVSRDSPLGFIPVLVTHLSKLCCSIAIHQGLIFKPSEINCDIWQFGNW